MPGLLAACGDTAIPLTTWFTGPFLFTLLCVSSGVKDWGISQATVSNSVGAVQIGLWQACADMPCMPSDAPDPDDSQCSRVAVFSAAIPSAPCRQGHCISGRSLVQGTSWDGNNLCDKSAAASAFSVMAILLMVYFLRLTLLQKIVCGEPSFEGAAWVSFLAGLCSMVCIAIWCNWLNIMNAEVGDMRENNGTDTILMTDLKTGFGVWLQIFAWLFLWVNALLCALASKQSGGGTDATGGANTLAPLSPEGNQGTPYALGPPASAFAIVVDPMTISRRAIISASASAPASASLGASESGAALGRAAPPVPAARPSSTANPAYAQQEGGGVGAVTMRPGGNALGARFSGRRSSLSDV